MAHPQQTIDLFLGHGRPDMALPDVRETAAACLLVLGRRAIHAYGARRGFDMSMLAELQAEAVSLWVDAWGCDRGIVEQVAKQVDDMLLPGDFPSVYVDDAVVVQPSVAC